MGKIVKGLFYLLGSLLGLTLILLIAIPLLVDPNDYRDEISQLVEQQTGRTLAIPGKIELSLFPWIGLEIGEMSLSNARGFEQKHFARVDRVDIKVKLLPLLHKAVEMDTIVLHGMSLNLAKNSNGQDNWSDLAQPASNSPGQPTAPQSIPEPSPPPTTAQEPAATALLTAFAINGLQVNDAHIRWDDQSQQQQIEVNHFNLRSGAISLTSEFPLEVSFNTTIHADKESPPLEGDISLKSLVGLNLDRGQYQLNQLQLRSTIKSPQLPGGQLSSELAGNLSADLQQQSAQADGLSIALLGMELTLNSTISQLDQAPRAEGAISLHITEAAPLLALLGDALPATINAQILQSITLNTNFKADVASEQVALDKFQFNFDQSHIRGSASVASFSKPAIKYELDIDSINIDRYFPPAAADSAQSGAKAAIAEAGSGAAQSSDEPLPIPVELLRNLDLDGSLRLGALQVMNLHSQKMVATIKARDGELSLAPLAAELYQGEFSGDVKIDLRSDLPTIRVTEKLTGVESGPLLKDLLGKDYVTGRAQLTASLTTSGDRISQFKKGLNGTAELRFEDGSVKGIDIAQLIREAYATYKKQPYQKPAQKPQTDFALLSASVNIKDGLVTNNDLNAQSPLLRISGSGQADLVTEKVDYRVRAAVVKSLEGQGGKPLSELNGLTIPLAIKGSLTAPKFSIDMAQLLDAKAKAKVEAAKEEVREETQQKIEQKKDALKQKLKEKFKLKF